MATTYTGAQYQLRVAQETLDAHIQSHATGRCQQCDSPGPCTPREAAAMVFARLGALPHRRRGATRPELLGARAVGGNPLWFWTPSR